MNYPIGVLFLYHKNDDVTRMNRNTWRRNNPSIPMIAIFTGPIEDMVFGDHHITECGKLGMRFLTIARHPFLAWRNCDIAFMAGYQSWSHLTPCDRWILLEWDVYCNMALVDFIQPTLHADVIGPTVPYPNREPGWSWFWETIRLHPNMQASVCGVVPLATTILSNRAMIDIGAYYEKNVIDCFSELRLATTANFLGYQPVSNSHPSSRHLTWQPLTTIDTSPGIYHPVKFVVPHSETTPVALPQTH